MLEDAALDRLFEWSRTLRRWAEAITGGGWRERARAIARREPVRPDPIPEGLSRDALMPAIRRARREALLAAALAEVIAQDGTVAFRWLTDCATTWIQAAFDAAVREACRVFGVDGREAARGLAVLGFGKLGAMELNPSSDVDLVVVYAEDGPIPGHPDRGWHEFYDTVARDAASILAATTAEGFGLRVDYDLRPEGRAGALANSLDALLAYYEQYGTALDRLAWTRARPVAGDLALGGRVVAAMQPFVYPRLGVSGALPALAQVLSRLRGASDAPGASFQLKTGRGGIRDIELVTAAHQLLHGGRCADLRETRTLEVLDRLFRHGFLDAETAGDLARAYRFLRRIEHLLQYREDRQTHLCPLSGPVFEGLAALIEPGSDPQRVRDQLEGHRTRATLRADRLFGLSGPANERDPFATLLDTAAETSAREAAARTIGFVEVEGTLARLDRMRSAPASPLHPRNEPRFPGLDRRLLQLAAQSLWADGALAFVSRIARSPRHRPLFEMARDDPRVFEALVQVAAHSAIVAETLVHDPAAAIENALTGFRGAWPDPAALRAEAMRCAGLAAEDLPEALIAMRRRSTLGVALRDLAEPDAEEAVGRALSALADACITACLHAAFGDASRGVAVLAFGRLGSREMGYRSDLDLLFVQESAADERRLAAIHRMLGLLTARGVTGTLYELDLRLRPSGTQGPLLVTADRAVQYYREEASGAELLGALNLRVAAGDEALGREVVAAAGRAATDRLRDPDSLRELFRVRTLQTAGVAGTGKTFYDPKLEAGGMLMIETAARLVGIRRSPVPPGTGTLALLKGFTAATGPRHPDLAHLERVYRFLLRLTNRAHLVLDRPIQQVPPAGPGADRLARSLGFERASAMWEQMRAMLAQARRACERIFEGIGVEPIPAGADRKDAPR